MQDATDPIRWPDVDPDHRADLRDAIHAMPSSRLVGLRVLGFSADGVSLVELPVHAALTFDGRAVQGGVVGLLADYAGVSAAAATLPPGWFMSTVGYEVHLVAPAAGQRLVAVGRAVTVGRSHAVARADVYAERDGVATLVAVATTTSRPLDTAARAAG